MKHAHILLRPDPTRTVIRPFAPDYPDQFRSKDRPRAKEIADRVLSLTPSDLRAEFGVVQASLDERHRDVEALLLRRYDEIAPQLELRYPAKIGRAHV